MQTPKTPQCVFICGLSLGLLRQRPEAITRTSFSQIVSYSSLNTWHIQSPPWEEAKWQRAQLSEMYFLSFFLYSFSIYLSFSSPHCGSKLAKWTAITNLFSFSLSFCLYPFLFCFFFFPALWKQFGESAQLSEIDLFSLFRLNSFLFPLSFFSFLFLPQATNRIKTLTLHKI